jgi:hypothetical protein
VNDERDFFLLRRDNTLARLTLDRGVPPRGQIRCQHARPDWSPRGHGPDGSRLTQRRGGDEGHHQVGRGTLHLGPSSPSTSRGRCRQPSASTNWTTAASTAPGCTSPRGLPAAGRSRWTRVARPSRTGWPLAAGRRSVRRMDQGPTNRCRVCGQAPVGGGAVLPGVRDASAADGPRLPSATRCPRPQAAEEGR